MCILQIVKERLKREGILMSMFASSAPSNSGFLDFFHNWALHAEDVGLGGHFVAVLEDDISFRYVEKHWPGQAARVHVPELEADDAEALSHEGLQYLAHPSRRWGRATEMDAPEFRMMMYVHPRLHTCSCSSYVRPSFSHARSCSSYDDVRAPPVPYLLLLFIRPLLLSICQLLLFKL